MAKDLNGHRKKRLCIDYSQSVNKYTYLDAYPLPRINEFVNKISQYRVFSSIDLRSAYHQIPLKSSDKLFTIFVRSATPNTGTGALALDIPSSAHPRDRAQDVSTLA